MKTTKEILTENRESVISSIKWVFKIWKSEDVKVKMIDLLDYAELHADVASLASSKRIKTDLKNMICKMAYVQNEPHREAERQSNIALYGTANPKLADIMAAAHDGESFNHLTKSWTKNSFEAGVNRY